MAPSNTIMIHMEEKLLPKEKNKVSRALDGIGKAGLRSMGCCYQLNTTWEKIRREKVVWGKADRLKRDKGDYLDF